MDADACRKKPAASQSLPPTALFRARSARVADLAAGVGAAFSGPPDTPPRCSRLTVPFVWEDAPGKPKSSPPPTSCNSATAAAATPAVAAEAVDPVPEGGGAGGEHQDSGGLADLPRPRPLKLPPRLQRVTTFAAADTRQGNGSGPAHADQAAGPPRPLKLPPRLQQVPVPVPPSSSFAVPEHTYTPSPSPSPSPKTVLHGPYSHTGRAERAPGCKPPKWVRSGGAALKRTPSAGMALLSRTLSKRRAAGAAVAPAAGGSGKNRGGGDHHERDAAGHGLDAPWWSPASSSSSSSVSTRFDHAGRGRPGDAREAASEEDDDGGSPRHSVRITRLTRNRSVPNLTTSNVWASVRRSVKQITPILHGARSWATARYGHW